MAEQIAPDWISFQPARWIAGTAEMDMLTEFVFFRLVVIAYEAGSPVITGSSKRNAMRCKVTVEQFNEAIEMLIELEKIQICDSGIYIRSVARRLDEANGRISARQRGAAISRRKRELKLQGKKQSEIDLMISAEFSDDQKYTTDNQSDHQHSNKTNKQTNKQTIQNRQGGVGGTGELKLEGETSDLANIAIDLWNEMAISNSLSQVQKISDGRRKKMLARLDDLGGLEVWEIALEKISQSDFLLGKIKGRNWKVSFDFMMQPASLTKIMEDQYKNSTSQSSGVMGHIRGMQDG